MLILPSSFIDCASTTDATTASTTNAPTTGSTDATTTDYNGTAIPFILAGVMGFLVLIVATVMLGTCVICICLHMRKPRRKCKNTTCEILMHELQVYELLYSSKIIVRL